MALKVVSRVRELDIISLVDIIFLLLIFALTVEVGGGGGKSWDPGTGGKHTTLKIDIGRGRVPDFPRLIQVKIVYANDTSRIDYPPDDQFIGLPRLSFQDMEEVGETMDDVDKYLENPLVYPIDGIEVKAEGDIPFKLVDLFVRKFSSAEQENFSLAYWGGRSK
jgi:hypothetical protein